MLSALLVAVQLFVTRRSNRILNVALVTATVVVLVLMSWTVFRFVSAQDSLQSAQRNGSDSVQLLSAARILVLQAQSRREPRTRRAGNRRCVRRGLTSGEEAPRRDPTVRAACWARRATVAGRTGSVVAVDALEQAVPRSEQCARARFATLDDRGRVQRSGHARDRSGNQTGARSSTPTPARDHPRASATLNDDATDARSGFGSALDRDPGAARARRRARAPRSPAPHRGVPVSARRTFGAAAAVLCCVLNAARRSPTLQRRHRATP